MNKSIEPLRKAAARAHDEAEAALERKAKIAETLREVITAEWSDGDLVVARHLPGQEYRGRYIARPLFSAPGCVTLSVFDYDPDGELDDCLDLDVLVWEFEVEK